MLFFIPFFALLTCPCPKRRQVENVGLRKVTVPTINVNKLLLECERWIF